MKPTGNSETLGARPWRQEARRSRPRLGARPVGAEGEHLHGTDDGRVEDAIVPDGRLAGGIALLKLEDRARQPEELPELIELQVAGALGEKRWPRWANWPAEARSGGR